MENNNELNKACEVALNKLKEVYEVEREKIESLIATQKEKEPLIDSFGRYLTEPKIGISYFYAYSDGEIDCEKWEGTDADEKRFKLLHCFVSQEKIRKYQEYKQSEMRILKRVAELNDGWSPNWNDREIKYSIAYDYGTSAFIGGINKYVDEATVYLSTFADAEQLISEMEDDLKTYFRIL